MLPIAMTTGASSYILYHSIPSIHCIGPALNEIVSFLQPTLIFAMLFLTFCRIEPRDLKPHRWHWWLLLIQGGVFTILGLIASWLIRVLPADSASAVVLIESAMMCFICPTATAAAVVVRKLGGDVPGIVTYIILINVLTALLVPMIVPLVHPVDDFDFWMSFSLIISKVFPLLIMPCLAAWLVRYLFPKVHRRLLKYPDLAFYIWAFALALAIAVTTKSIMASEMGLGLLLLIALVSLISCVVQFSLGRYIGSRYRSSEVTAGQSIGQKNTVFAIWMSYTFMTKETAIVGGLYSVWHNIYNSWQLYKAGKSSK